MVLVIGNLGNMGSRYTAVLRSLGVQFCGIDVKNRLSEMQQEDLICAASKIIVAVPTIKHVEAIQNISRIRSRKSLPTAHILCEKPIVKNIEGIAFLRREQESGSVRIFSVNQYAHLPNYSEFFGAKGRTYYNYFKHGDDGLAWDCFPMFVLANNAVVLNNRSPIWTCRINGVTVNIGSMDMAYIEMVKDFLGPMNRVWDLGSVEIGTRKVLKWIAEEEEDILESLSRE